MEIFVTYYIKVNDERQILNIINILTNLRDHFLEHRASYIVPERLLDLSKMYFWMNESLKNYRASIRQES